MYAYGHAAQTPQVLGSNPRGRTSSPQVSGTVVVGGSDSRSHSDANGPAAGQEVCGGYAPEAARFRCPIGWPATAR
jgi:hypothetical protein